jgi:polar amino acid transport system substrate-binding protein
LPVAAGGDKLRAAESEARKGEIMKPRKILFMVASIMGAIGALPGFPGLAMAAETLTVSISLDIPPYVIKSASEGLEVDIVRGALSGQQLSFVQMPYADLQTAIQQKKADVSIGVQPTDKSVFYSHSLIAFVNLAIAKKSDHLKIDSIAALKGHKVLTWQDAYLELGDEFASLFAPGAPYRADDIEVANQEDQVRRFWQGDNLVIVIDRSIFAYFSKKMGHAMSEVDLFALFPPVTDFKAGFANAALRDRFNQGLDGLCGNGGYAKLLDRYDVVFPLPTVCP